MADTTLLHSLTLEGFRAFLQPKAFGFSKKPCLAIFAPNGSVRYTPVRWRNNNKNPKSQLRKIPACLT
jgi:hypothetical protein